MQGVEAPGLTRKRRQWAAVAERRAWILLGREHEAHRQLLALHARPLFGRIGIEPFEIDPLPVLTAARGYDHPLHQVVAPQRHVASRVAQAGLLIPLLIVADLFGDRNQPGDHTVGHEPAALGLVARHPRHPRHPGHPGHHHLHGHHPRTKLLESGWEAGLAGLSGLFTRLATALRPAGLAVGIFRYIHVGCIAADCAGLPIRHERHACHGPQFLDRKYFRLRPLRLLLEQRLVERGYGRGRLHLGPPPRLDRLREGRAAEFLCRRLLDRLDVRGCKPGLVLDHLRLLVAGRGLRAGRTHAAPHEPAGERRHDGHADLFSLREEK